MNEHEHQKIVIAAIRRDFPDVILFAIPNIGTAIPQRGRWLKDEGVLAGVPDLMVARAAQGFLGLFVEMKTLTGSTSKEQKAIIAKLSSEGYLCKVCKGHESALSAIREYLGSTT